MSVGGPLSSGTPTCWCWRGVNALIIIVAPGLPWAKQRGPNKTKRSAYPAPEPALGLGPIGRCLRGVARPSVKLNTRDPSAGTGARAGGGLERFPLQTVSFPSPQHRYWIQSPPEGLDPGELLGLINSPPTMGQHVGVHPSGGKGSFAGPWAWLKSSAVFVCLLQTAVPSSRPFWSPSEGF